MRRFVASVLTIMLITAARPSTANLVLSADGNTVYDTSTGLTWLANANLAGAPTSPSEPNMPFGPGCTGASTAGCVGASGSMNWNTAVRWIQALNADNYEGHDNWQLPAQGDTDFPPDAGLGCTATGLPGNTFGFNCSGGALGNLFYRSLGLAAFNSAIPTAQNTVAVPKSALTFTNFQPNFYWSSTANANSALGYLVVNFATGRGDTIVGDNSPNASGSHGVAGTVLNVLPMIQTNNPTTPGPLQSALNGNGIYDPATGIIWPMNANPAANPALVAQVGMSICGPIGTNGTSGAGNCVNSNGTMNHASAVEFVQGLNDIHYLNTQGWELPPFGNQACIGAACSDPTLNPLAYLYYNTLGLNAGTNVAAPASANDPFANIQPSYYWECQASDNSNPLTSSCDYASSLPAANFGWDFDLGNGYDSTDVVGQEFYVTAYYVPEPPPWTVLLPAFALSALAARPRISDPRGRLPLPPDTAFAPQTRRCPAAARVTRELEI